MSLFQKSYTISKQHSAQHWGSGSLPVLSTPAMIAFMENTAYDYCQEQLAHGETTVGMAIEVQHLAASKIGQTVKVCLSHIQKEDRRFHFDIEVYLGEKLIGKGRHKRAIIRIESFLNQLD